MMNKEYKQTDVKVGITYSEYLVIILSIKRFREREQCDLDYWNSKNETEHAAVNLKHIQIAEQLIQKLRKLDFPIEDMINA